MVEKLEKPNADQPRIKRLKEIESEMLKQFKDQDVYKVDAPEDYSHLSVEDKNKSKYFATFPYPYMNGHLHLGKFTMTVFDVVYRSRLHHGQGWDSN